jgi:F-type H+-transporting ATPase subunit delta
MRDRGVASRYASALLVTAKAENVMADVADSYAAVAQIMRENPALPSFLEGPQVAEDEKKQLISNLFGDKVEPVLVRFFHLLVDKNRIEFLVDIAEVFADLVESEQGIAHAMVTTAVPLADDLEQDLVTKLAALTKAKIIVEKNVDPSVIGGVSVTVGDKIIDGTVRTQLDQMREHLAKVQLR